MDIKPQLNKDLQSRAQDQLWLAVRPFTVHEIHHGVLKFNSAGTMSRDLHNIGDWTINTMFAQFILSVNLTMGVGTLIALRFTKADRARTLISRTMGIATVVFSLAPVVALFNLTRHLSHYSRADLERLRG